MLTLRGQLEGQIDGAMSDFECDDAVEFEELVALALAEASSGPAPRPIVKAQLLARLAEDAPVPAGFSLTVRAGRRLGPAPGARYPDEGAVRQPPKRLRDSAPRRCNPVLGFQRTIMAATKRCYVISGSVYTLGRRLGQGDFVHRGRRHRGPAKAVRADEGRSRALVVQPEDYTAIAGLS